MDRPAPKTEQEFLEQYDASQYASPMCSVDIVIFSLIEERLHAVLAKRAIFPAKGKWALPGGIIDIEQDATIEATAIRKLKARTGISAPYLEQVCSEGNSTRDPRHWSVSVVYFALLDHNSVKLVAGDGVSEVRWFPVNDIGVTVSLALDHQKLFSYALGRLRNKVRYTMLPAFMLPEEFTLTELVHAYQAILGDIDQALIRKRINREGLVVETGNCRTGSYRPAKLFKVAPGADQHFFERVIKG